MLGLVAPTECGLRPRWQRNGANAANYGDVDPATPVPKNECGTQYRPHVLCFPYLSENMFIKVERDGPVDPSNAPAKRRKNLSPQRWNLGRGGHVFFPDELSGSLQSVCERLPCLKTKHWMSVFVDLHARRMSNGYQLEVSASQSNLQKNEESQKEHILLYI